MRLCKRDPETRVYIERVPTDRREALVVEVPEVFLTAKGGSGTSVRELRTDQEQKEDPLSDMLRLSEEADQSHEVCSKSEYLQEGVKKFDTLWLKQSRLKWPGSEW